MSRISKLRSSSAKFAMKGVNVTLASATLIASAAGVLTVTDASKLVDAHSRSTNKEANLAAKILEIDRSELVNKNYLKLANEIDNYLTGKTESFTVDSLMDEQSPSASLENSVDINRSNEALQNLSAILDTQLEETADDADDQEEQNIEEINDINSLINQVVESQETYQDVSETKSKIEEFKEVKEIEVIEEKPQISAAAEKLKEIVQIEDRKSDRDTADRGETMKSIDEIKSVMRPIDEKSEVEKSEEIVTHKERSADKKEMIEEIREIKEVEKFENIGDLKTSEKIEDLQPAEPKEVAPILEPTNKEIKSNDRSETIEKFEEAIEGRATLRIARKFANHKQYDTIEIVKLTKGIRHVDGSEVWEPIVFTAKDLTEDQKTIRSAAKVHDLLIPDFVATYTPKSQNDTIEDTLTYAKGQEIPQEDTRVEEIRSNDNIKVFERVIRLVKEDGSELKRITSSIAETQVEIPKQIDGYYAEQTSLSFESGQDEITVVYKPIVERFSAVRRYQISQANGKGSLFDRFYRDILVTGEINRMTGEEKLDTDLIENKINEDYQLIGYNLRSSEFDHKNLTAVQFFDEIEKRETNEISKEEIVSQITPKKVHESATSMLESMPTLSNRAEYSKYTSFDESYSRLLQRSSIENLVFGISEGRYDYQNSDRVLKPSQESVLAAEVNSRFTDRLLERINEFRRSIGLSELEKVKTTAEMDRQFASATIFNYLANDHSNSKVGRAFEKATGLERIETMQPAHDLSTTQQGLTPEAAADSLFRTILKEANSYLSQDGGETGHLEQLIDPNQKSIYAGVFIGQHEVKDTFMKMFGKQIKSGSKSVYRLSTTLHYFK